MIATIIALIILSLGYNEIVKGTIFVLGLLITLLCFFKGVGSCFYNIYWFYLSYKRSSLES